MNITVDGSDMDAVYEELDPLLGDLLEKHGRLTVLATMAAILVGELGGEALHVVRQIIEAEERE